MLTLRAPRQSRQQLNERIVAALQAVARMGDGKRSPSDVARSIGEPRQRVEFAMQDMARDGLLVQDGTIPTATRPAKAYRLAERRPCWLGLDSVPPASARVVAYLDRYFGWICDGNGGELTEADRAAFWMIEAALKSKAFSGAHAIALLHVHGRSVWCFGRLDMQSVYTEALDMMERRLEAVLGCQAHS